MKAVMYHYVREEDQNFPYFKFLHFKDFKKQLDYLDSTFNIVHPQVLRRSIEAGELAKGIVLTFDDGLKDHYKYIVPELIKRGLSAIFYISTGVYDNTILGVHKLHLLLGRFESKLIHRHLMKLISDEMLSHAHVEEFQTIPYSCQDNDEYTSLVKKIMNYLIGYEYREKILDELMQFFFGSDTSLFDSFYLNKNELKEMHEAGMVIGSHTKTHPVMSKLSKEEQQQELSGSFNFLDDLCIMQPYKTFCYPYGGFHSFTNETETLLDDMGCMFSFNVEARDISGDDIIFRPQALPRYDCNHFPYGQLWQNKVLLNEEK